MSKTLSTDVSTTVCVCGHEKVFHHIYQTLSDDCSGGNFCRCAKYSPLCSALEAQQHNAAITGLRKANPCPKCESTGLTEFKYHSARRWYHWGCGLGPEEHIHFICSVCKAHWSKAIDIQNPMEVTIRI